MTSHDSSNETNHNNSINNNGTCPASSLSTQCKECQTCMKHLISSFKSIHSKPMALFQAMGVNISSYSLHSNGIKIEIPPTRLPMSSTTVSREGGVGFGGGVAAAGGSAGRSDGRTHTNVTTTTKTWQQEQEESTANQARQTHSSSSSISTNSSGNGTSIMVELKNRLTKRFRNSVVDSSSSQPSSSSSDSTYIPTTPTTPPTAVATSAIPSKPQTMELQIICQTCGNDGPEGGARAFVKGPQPLSIVLCSNRLSSQEEINEVLVHELIHVYDVHHRQWDLTNCYTLAKSEVRAAREAECAGATMSFTKRYCAREKARVATKNMFPDVGLQCVAAVFEEAMADEAPFWKNNNNKEKKGVGGKEEESGDLSIHGRSFQSSYARSDPSACSS